MKIEDIADAAFRAIEKALPSALAPIFKAFDVLAGQFDALKSVVGEIQAKVADGSLRGERGQQGERGEPGDSGADGKDAEPINLRDVIAELSIAPEVKTVLALLAAEAAPEGIARHLAENPPAAGKDGANGRDGADGKSVTLDDIKGLIESQSAQWHLEFERRAQDTLQRAIEKMPIPRDGKDGRDGRDGKDGKNGTNGVDGLAFDTAEGEFDIERGFVVKMVGGGREAEFVLPYMVHRGFWREGLGVKATQSITHDGALWIAKRDNASKPCLENAEDWQLAARKGRDGRDGKDGKAPPGPVKLGDGNA